MQVLTPCLALETAMCDELMCAIDDTSVNGRVKWSEQSASFFFSPSCSHIGIQIIEDSRSQKNAPVNHRSSCINNTGMNLVRALNIWKECAGKFDSKRGFVCLEAWRPTRNSRRISDVKDVFSRRAERVRHNRRVARKGYQSGWLPPPTYMRVSWPQVHQTNSVPECATIHHRMQC